MDKILRASKIGFPCIRNLWYSVNGFKGNISTKTQRIFDVGTTLEPLIIEWLKNEGWQVEYNAGSQNAELEYEIPVKGGCIAGHPDCFINFDTLIDIKTMNDRSFLQWRKEGSLKSKPQYVDQVHCYALGAINKGRKIKDLGICGMNKNTSEIRIDFFDFDFDRAEYLKLKAESVFAMSEAPETTPSENWACRYCEFSHFCTMNKTMKKTKVGDDIAVTSDKNIIDALELLQEAREMKTAAIELEAEAKEVLDENVRQQGIKTIKAGELTLTLKEILKKAFNQKKFAAENPQLYEQYKEDRTELRYNISEL
ncbi:MAG: DUF2800 domain-containing protein [Synergistaceae bacterium]|nr:DUF2800 domain-containing protein [Synergistaceae bacterium]MBR0033412.1 DUF2800 domain-containing protein [Bacilli bacterium]MBR0076303.1 DUF2800 domain-containing protein [Synergistaceae bacterium]